MRGLLGDLGVEVKVNMDSMAVKSISSRWGAGRVRHIEVRELWVQGRVAKGDLLVGFVHDLETVSECRRRFI